MSVLSQPAPGARSSGTPAARRKLLPLLLLFGSLKLVLQFSITLASEHAGYGMFRDEWYYLVCGRRLQLGYVDQPPFVALQARLAELLFGWHHLVLFRLLPALAGALVVMLAGLLAEALGGSRRAAGLAMFAVLTVPVFTATQSFLSMNAWEPVFWMSAVLALARLLQASTRHAARWWLLLGASIGLGFENKASTLFFAAALMIALLVTPARRLLRTRGFLLACAVAALLALPNVLWQVSNGFPTWQWLRAVQHSNKDVILSPWRFVLAQWLMLGPVHVLVWLPGLILLLRTRALRPLGALFLAFFGIMLALHAKDYYLAPLYPLLFAAGAIVWARRMEDARRPLLRSLPFALPLLCGFLVALPFTVPVLRPAEYVRYARALHFAPMESETHRAALLPEFFADFLGWHELVDGVARVYHALPPAEQARTGIFASNYGEASSLNILGQTVGLPSTISGHQQYWLWGPGRYTGQEMIVVTPSTPKEMLHYYRSCTVEAHQASPYWMPWEQRYIYLCHDRLQSYQQDWNTLKLYR